MQTVLVPGVGWPKYVAPPEKKTTKFTLNKTGAKILTCIAANPGSTTQKLAELLGMNKSTLGKNIHYYVSCGKVESVLIPHTIGNAKKYYVKNNVTLATQRNKTTL